MAARLAFVPTLVLYPFRFRDPPSGKWVRARHMTIRRDEPRKTDCSDVSNGKRLTPVHPGDVLLKDFIEPMGVSRYRVAKNIHVAQRRIDLICRGDAAVSAEMALRLGRLFGTTPEFWINLQAQYDLEVAARAARKQIAKAVVPLAT
jgi:addiction module HigA family antidote